MTDARTEFLNVHEKVISSVNDQSLVQLERINEKVVKEAINLLKPCKSDAVFEMSSDYYLNAPPELVSHLTKLIKLYLSHGYVPKAVLMCTLLPLLKDNLGDITSSENYRAIAGGCLLLKLLGFGYDSTRR